MSVPHLVITCLPLLVSSSPSSLTYHYGDGSYYTGAVDSEGRPREGVLYSRAGHVSYNGSYERGLYHGEGSWYGEGGEKYQGEFRGGEASGKGVWTDKNTGEKVEGQFKNGMVSGEAVWDRPVHGVRLEGVFKRGHAHGHGVVVWPDMGYKFSSQFKKGYPHGIAVLSYPNSTTAWTGRFTNGVPKEEVAEQDIKKIFDFFTEHPFRSKIKLTNI